MLPSPAVPEASVSRLCLRQAAVWGGGWGGGLQAGWGREFFCRPAGMLVYSRGARGVQALVPGGWRLPRPQAEHGLEGLAHRAPPLEELDRRVPGGRALPLRPPVLICALPCGSSAAGAHLLTRQELPGAEMLAGWASWAVAGWLCSAGAPAIRAREQGGVMGRPKHCHDPLPAEHCSPHLPC